MLRTLTLLGGYKRLVGKNGLNDDEIVYAIELGCLVEQAVPSSLPDIILVTFKKRLLATIADEVVFQRLRNQLCVCIARDFLPC